MFPWFSHAFVDSPARGAPLGPWFFTTIGDVWKRRILKSSYHNFQKHSIEYKFKSDTLATKEKVSLELSIICCPSLSSYVFINNLDVCQLPSGNLT